MKQALPLSFYTVQLVANFSWVFIYLEAKDLLAVSFTFLCFNLILTHYPVKLKPATITDHILYWYMVISNTVPHFDLQLSIIILFPMGLNLCCDCMS